MKYFKKIQLLLLFVIISTLLLAACGKEKDTSRVTNANVEENMVGNEEPSPTPTIAPIKEAKDNDNVKKNDEKNKSKDPDILAFKDKITSGPMEIRDISSTELVKEIKIGWNLGNTLDAEGYGTYSEISWGNPLTKKEMIDTVKDAGFNTLRIPITWQQHIGPAPDYKIHEQWLDRVEEVVNYGMVNDMFVIINAHHEDWYIPYYDNADTAIDMMEKLWKQIADRFENYDEHLIFEGLNEPRHKGAPDEWTGGNEEGWDVVNQLNAAFVKTIRDSGGNNPLRHLMITPYAASSNTITWDKFIVQEDDKVIVSIHAYTPYNFALNVNGTSEWSVTNPNDTSEIDSLINNIDNYFISKGIPVILGEFGSVNKNNLEARVAWAKYYVNKSKEKGVPCIVWDNGVHQGSGEILGLLDRKNLTWTSPEIIEAFMKGLE